MAEKVAKLGVSREKDFMYYVKDGSVWKVQRKQPGVPKGRPEKVADGGFEMDTNYIYFVDRDGDVARAKRAIGGQKRKKGARRARRSAKRATRKVAKKKGGGKAKKKIAVKKKGGKKKGRR
jgi:type IV secretory pathway VirB6-like protein